MNNNIEVKGPISYIIVEKDNIAYKIIVDTANIPQLNIIKGSWYLKKQSRAAKGLIPACTIDGKTIYMGRFLCMATPEGIPEGDYVADHIFGNQLDNRLSQLQVISKAENTKKQQVYHDLTKTNASGFRGVSKYRDSYIARVAGHYCGIFPTAEEADEVARCYRNGLNEQRLVRIAA